MLLPNCEFAVIEDEKLRDYCLDSEHPVGKHKARQFLERLGLMQKDYLLLKNLILKKIQVRECLEVERSEFGRRFIVDIFLTIFAKKAKVRTSWIMKKKRIYPQIDLLLYNRLR